MALVALLLVSQLPKLGGPTLAGPWLLVVVIAGAVAAAVPSYQASQHLSPLSTIDALNTNTSLARLIALTLTALAATLLVRSAATGQDRLVLILLCSALVLRPEVQYLGIPWSFLVGLAIIGPLVVSRAVPSESLTGPGRLELRARTKVVVDQAAAAHTARELKTALRRKVATADLEATDADKIRTTVTQALGDRAEGPTSDQRRGAFNWSGEPDALKRGLVECGGVHRWRSAQLRLRRPDSHGPGRHHGTGELVGAPRRDRGLQVPLGRVRFRLPVPEDPGLDRAGQGGSALCTSWRHRNPGRHGALGCSRRGPSRGTAAPSTCRPVRGPWRRRRPVDAQNGWTTGDRPRRGLHDQSVRAVDLRGGRGGSHSYSHRPSGFRCNFAGRQDHPAVTKHATGTVDNPTRRSRREVGTVTRLPRHSPRKGMSRPGEIVDLHASLRRQRHTAAFRRPFDAGSRAGPGFLDARSGANRRTVSTSRRPSALTALDVPAS